MSALFSEDGISQDDVENYPVSFDEWGTKYFTYVILEKGLSLSNLSASVQCCLCVRLLVHCDDCISAQ